MDIESNFDVFSNKLEILFVKIYYSFYNVFGYLMKQEPKGSIKNNLHQLRVKDGQSKS